MTTDFARRRFNEMVLPHLDDAYGLARWLTGNRTDAEDVVQDACMRALASLETAVVERPRAWLLTIVRNTAFSWMAKQPPPTAADRQSKLIGSAFFGLRANPGRRPPLQIPLRPNI